MLSKEEILGQIEKVSRQASYATDAITALRKSKEMLLLTSMLRAPGPCKFDAANNRYILPGDELLAGFNPSKTYSTKELLEMVWRTNLRVRMAYSTYDQISSSGKLVTLTGLLKRSVKS